MAMKVKDYPDVYLKEWWYKIKLRKAQGWPIEDSVIAEVKAEMEKRGFDLDG